MKKFESLNYFSDEIIVVDNHNEIIFMNNNYKRKYKDFTDIKKLSHNMSFDICPIATENIDNYSPVWHALNSKENFFACVNFEISHNNILYINLYSVKKGKYTILFLTDVTSDNEIEFYKKEINEIKQKCKILEFENHDLHKIQEKAQSQAIRIALINKISNMIRESLDVNKIMTSALSELSIMFGAYKVYFATRTDNSFSIYNFLNEEVNYPEKFTFDEETNQQIFSGKISVSHSMFEYVGAKSFKQPVTRIIVPVIHMQNFLGILVLLSYQKKELSEELEILEAVSSQLGNALSLAKLYQKNIDTVNELKSTLQELKETQLQLINSEKMASLGQLVAGVAHEINTPVASIKSNNAILKKFIPKIKDKEVSEILESINNIDFEAINRISNIVVSLKRFVRLDEAELQKADINKELDLTLELIRHETKNRITIKKNYGEIPMINCYPNMLNQVFTNILVNACQAIADKGTITITTEYIDKNLLVKISDDGMGIPANQLDKIFTAGFTTKGIGIGTGLGLAICNKIIEKHNGKITVKSEVGKGSEFTITIFGE